MAPSRRNLVPGSTTNLPSFLCRRESIAALPGPHRSHGVMDAGFLHGIWTAALLAVFAAIVFWAWSGRRKHDFDEAARLPLDDDTDEATEPGREDTRHG